MKLEATILHYFVDSSRSPTSANEEIHFSAREVFNNLMAEKEKKAEHEITVTAEVHKPAEKTPVARKQPTLTQQPTVGFK